MEKNKKLRVIKIAVGSTLAILISNLLHLNYSTSAGVITLLTIQNTKIETLQIAVKRLMAYVLSLLIAFTMFELFGYHILSFCLYLFVFVYFCVLFSWQDALSICMVITTHFMMEGTMNFAWIRNESLLLFIGMSIGVVFNLFMVKNYKAIVQDQEAVEEDMRKLICTIADNLLEHNREKDEKYCFKTLESRVEEAISKAYENVNNTLVSDTKYYMEYMEMRKRQCVVLKNIYKQVDSLDITYPQHYIISRFMKEMSLHFHEYNSVMIMVEELGRLKEEFLNDSLPETREEFESRALLYFIVNELQSFLIIKRNFIQTLTDSELERYWHKLKKEELKSLKTKCGSRTRNYRK